jgi:orotate phosphoribosyltransferase
MVQDIKQVIGTNNLMVVSPDVGGVGAPAGSQAHDAPLAIVDKRRERPGDSEVMNVIGDVTGRTCILVDDIVDSGGTLVNAAEALLNHGATLVTGYISHGVLSGGAVARIMASRLKELVITDSIQPSDSVKNAHNIRVLPIAALLGEAIARTAEENRCRACSTRLLHSLVAALIFEGHTELGSVRLDLARAADDEVLRQDLGDPQLPQMLAGELDRVLGGLFPRFRAGADDLDDFVDALRHDASPCHNGGTLRHPRDLVPAAALPYQPHSTPNSAKCVVLGDPRFVSRVYALAPFRATTYSFANQEYEAHAR